MIGATAVEFRGLFPHLAGDSRPGESPFTPALIERRKKSGHVDFTGCRIIFQWGGAVGEERCRECVWLLSSRQVRSKFKQIAPVRPAGSPAVTSGRGLRPRLSASARTDSSRARRRRGETVGARRSVLRSRILISKADPACYPVSRPIAASEVQE